VGAWAKLIGTFVITFSVFILNQFCFTCILHQWYFTFVLLRDFKKPTITDH